ncbi:MAG: hypothetical protein DHS20C06_02190 [Hyphobacterium sp.]|nr:MAG: hypothetical protein DHS20C06_02190 [Hyphobacterium sp.]
MKAIAAIAAALMCSAAAFSDSSIYPQPVSDALAMTHDASDEAVWRFTMRVSMNDNSMDVGYDGAQDDGAQWTLLSPASPETLTEDLSDMWMDMITPDDTENAEDGEGVGLSVGSDGGLFFTAETASMIAGNVQRVSGGQYSFDPDIDPESDENDSMAEHLDGELALASAGHVEQIRIFAPESFKPNPAARIHEFELIMDFRQLDGMPAPIMTSMSTVVDVSALFQRQQQSVRFEFSDVEYVEP